MRSWVKIVGVRNIKTEVSLLLKIKQRFKVTVRCNKCGEKYILRGKRTSEGQFETGFKRCICGNEEHLEVDANPE
ncbi:hypothetical protein BKP37_07640 [Anaerobacillus alkalilacustris]|uniref:Uncharacterized protein n=1 Tax=Anaerobacillus alkalilacustris TaxID=393763 RepID=A0A1S2LRK6_9BACI|nr:hypothetical protein [Anaerobacillus alkalilacustris]OIJ14840.1 hypothetical protein BKP37_07640 [Anaerobacillus alkalilacustris]